MQFGPNLKIVMKTLTINIMMMVGMLMKMMKLMKLILMIFLENYVLVHLVWNPLDLQHSAFLVSLTAHHCTTLHCTTLPCIGLQIFFVVSSKIWF